jgi:hypothetical protein
VLLLSKPSMEKDPAPRTRTATAKPIASRWYSNPSPFCRPNQFNFEKIRVFRDFLANALQNRLLRGRI